jgi:DNA-directed RNA polymerase alpha subunit
VASEYLRLAQLLEEAAAALRKADVVLQGLPPVRPTPVKTLKLSVRLQNLLFRNGVEYVEQLVQMTEDELLLLPNFGMSSLYDLVRALRARGLSLAGDGPTLRHLRRMEEEERQAGVSPGRANA